MRSLGQLTCAAAAALIAVAVAGPSIAQNLGNDPLTGGLVGAGIGGGLGMALGGEKGAKTGAIIGGGVGVLQGMQPQPQPGYAQPQPGYAQPQPGYAQPQPSLLQQNNPITGGLVGAGIGGGLGAALGGEKGAKTGAIIGGGIGVLQGMQPQQPQYRQPQPAYAPPPPAYYEPPPAAYQPQPAYRPAPTQFMRNVQTSLVNLGYNPGPVDGLSGPTTRVAIRMYQRDYGLPITGKADAALLAHMRRNGG